MQDGWFQGDHEPLEDFKKGLIGQLSIAAIMAAFAAWTWLVFDPNSKVKYRVSRTDARFLNVQ